MKFKIFIINLLSLFLGFSASGQYSELGVFGGGSHFTGDVGNYNVHLPQGYAFGGFYRYVLNDRWSFRAQINYGKIANADSLSNISFRQNRNLHFSSTILEGSLLAEFNFLRFKPGSRYDHTTYLVGGFGIFSFNPKATYQGQTYELQALNTEGQGLGGNPAPYSKGSSFFIFGIGHKFSVGRFTSIGIESTCRSTRTDYLDDVGGYYADPDEILENYGAVSAALSDRSIIPSDKENLLRGDPNTNDWYFFTGITLQFKFGELLEKCVYIFN
tara:strand:+ start:1395 stop:2210 length:816 start_codon:yes stop_codon:yes gene_type:complete